MPDEPKAALTRKRISFGLRRVFALVTLIAILTWVGLRTYDWYTSVPLGSAVVTFNSRASADLALKSIAPLTEDEIVAAVQKRLSAPDYTSSPDATTITSMLNRIASSRRLPKGAWLEMNPHAQQGVWRIDLVMMASNNSGYGMVIRSIPEPKFRKAEPTAFSTPPSPLGGP